MRKYSKAFVSTLSFTIYGTTSTEGPVTTARMIRNNMIDHLEEAVAKGRIKRFEYRFDFDELKRAEDILKKSKNVEVVKKGEEI